MHAAPFRNRGSRTLGVSVRRALVMVATGFLSLAGAPRAGAQPFNPPLGPYVNPRPEDFAGASSYTAQDRVVLTSYFYWYDVYSGAHLTNSDGSDALTDHPPTLTGFSYKSTAWHRQQLLDMMAAGIDVLLPVYWGEPSQRLAGRPVSEQPWSFAGIPPLVAARSELLAQGKSPPRLGMFYDTSTLQWNAANRQIDLTTDHGRAWFYESIRDFFSLVPPRDWAMIDGKPVVFLYAAGFAAAHDQSCIDFVKQAFARDFAGREPYIVREISWNVKADNTYAWGGAVSLKNAGVAALGPGYDHSAVPGREPLVVPREGGAFFERNWVRFLRNPTKLVHVETWNEYHEGTDIAASREYGDAYLKLNRRFVDMFKAGIKPPRPRGPFSDAKSVFTTLAGTNGAHGLFQFDSADGATAVVEAGGSECRQTVPTSNAGKYVYFRLDDSFKWADQMLVDVEVEYFDSGDGSFNLEYDGPDPNAPFNGAYTSSKLLVRLQDSGAWKTARFRLLEARFLNSQNGGADFRIAVPSGVLCVRRVAVTRLGVPAESGQTRRGWQQDFGNPVGSEWAWIGDRERIEQEAGLIRLRSGAGQPARLVLRQPDVGAREIEVLARLRLTRSPEGTGDDLGGLVVGVDAAGLSGLTSEFRSEAAAGNLVVLKGAGGGDGTVATFAWRPNAWYWMRLRHEPQAITAYPDLRVRVWPADGETPEPDSWLAWWDYYPAGAALQGFVGLVAGTAADPALECDYLLVTNSTAPLVAVSLPAMKPERPVLEPVGWLPGEGMTLDVHGAPETSYLVESSADLTVWDETLVVTDATGRSGFADRTTAAATQRFYRARTLQ